MKIKDMKVLIVMHVSSLYRVLLNFIPERIRWITITTFDKSSVQFSVA